jgi:hypothetical protein
MGKFPEGPLGTDNPDTAVKADFPSHYRSAVRFVDDMLK